jgi:hypothetical protein
MGKDDEFRVLHAFADYGVEAEPLSAYGEVTRWTIDPEPNEFVAETRAVDLLDELPSGSFDLGLFHPKCTKWSRMTSIDGDPDEHEDQIPRAREIARETCDHWIVENRPEAPLENPTVLNGKMFGLPVWYERAFETSFPVDQPPRERPLDTEVSTYFSADRTKQWWRSIKGVRGDYPKEHLVKNCLPAVYVHFLVRSYSKAVNERDAREAQDNNSHPRRVAADQVTLTESGP